MTRRAIIAIVAVALIGLGLLMFSEESHDSELIEASQADSMWNDLQTLEDAQDYFWTRNSHYTADVDSLNFQQRSRAVLVIEAAEMRWSAVLTDNVKRRRCRITGGEPGPGADSISGRISC